MNPSLFHVPGALLSREELIAARLDGLVFELGDGFLPADIPEFDGARVAALRDLLPTGYGICGPSAAWVHGFGTSSPVRHHFQRVTAHRPRAPQQAAVMLHDVRLADDDIVVISGAAVSAPVRTMVDLAMRQDKNDDYALWLRTMATADPALIPLARTAIRARSRMPGKRAALTVLDALAHEAGQQDQDDVTRYTS